tara:strand:- start:838 stop:1164 length:327 start_codon:yes stop_codon:yes gene_type:complete
MFIAKKADLPESYEKLKGYHARLEKKSYDTFLPIYAHSVYNFSTIRFFKNRKFSKFAEGATYAIDFVVSTKVKNEKTFVNCFINKVKFVNPAPEMDVGDVLDLDSDEE